MNRRLIHAIIIVYSLGCWAGKRLHHGNRHDQFVAACISTAETGADRRHVEGPRRAAAQCLAIYLHDWLGSTPGVLVMDDAQYRAWFDDAMDSSLSVRPPYSLKLFTGLAPLDAAVHWTWENGKLTCGVCRVDGERTAAFAYAGGRDLKSLLGEATRWVCVELKLNEKSSPLARDLAKANPEALETAYLQRYANVVWGDPGITKLRVLRPLMSDARANGVVAAAFFEAGLQIGKQPDESPISSIRLLAQVLPFVLGGDQEEIAIRFLKGNTLERPAIEDELLEFVKAAGKSDDDQALEKLESPDKPKPLGDNIIKDTSVAADAARNSIARQCGAIRCLAAIHSEKLKPHLAQCRQGGDARVRKAVAFAWEQYDAPIGDAQLKILAADPDAAIALTASLACRRTASREAIFWNWRKLLRAEPRDISALSVLARNGTVADATLLRGTQSIQTRHIERWHWKDRSTWGTSTPMPAVSGCATPIPK